MQAHIEIIARRVCVTVGIVALAVILLVLLWYASEVLLLVFAAVLLAVFLRGLGSLLAKHTPLSSGWSLGVVIVTLTALVTVTVWLLAPAVATQADQLSQNLSQSLQQLGDQLGRYKWGRQLMAQTPGFGELTRKADLFSRVTGLFSTTLGVLANIVIVGFIGLYLAIKPSLYVNGTVRLFPNRIRGRMRGVFGEAGETLRYWLVGRVILMVLNGVLTALGLWLLGTPLALTLGILAGLLNFIPNVGPLIAGIPAVLIAWTQSPTQALYVFLLYLALQNVDGYVLTPLVQQRTVALPPALTILAQLIFGMLAGTLGLLLATPIAAAGVVFVKRLYLEDVLGDRGQQPSPSRPNSSGSSASDSGGL